MEHGRSVSTRWVISPPSGGIVEFPVELCAIGDALLRDVGVGCGGELVEQRQPRELGCGVRGHGDRGADLH